MIFSRLENITEEKRTSFRVGFPDFISLNPLNTFFTSFSISDVLMGEIYLNLPTQIYFANGNSIEYFYNAVGQKMSKKVYDMTSTPAGTIKEVDYLDGFHYAGGIPQFFPTSEGYVSVTASNSIQHPYIFNYVYNYTDHLGNIRLSYTKDPLGTGVTPLEIMEENHYYPFGLKHAVYTGTIKQKYELVDGMENVARPGYVYKTDYQYKYNGKEWQDELGLNWYDYHARNYQADLGRWTTIDPMAPKYFSHSPYSYTLNNPVYFIDPTGMMVETGDPPIMEGDIVELETAVIVGKKPESSSSGSSNSSIGGMPSFDFMRDTEFGQTANRAYDNMYSPQNKAGYLKMQQAKREGELFAIGVMGGSIAAIYLAPAVITYGSIYAETQVGSYIMQSAGKFALDITAKGLFNGGEINTSDVTSSLAGSLVPWQVSGLVSEGTGLGTKALMGESIEPNDYWSAGIKSFMVSPLGTATGTAMEAVTNKTAGAVVEAVHNNAQGAVIDDQLSH